MPQSALLCIIWYQISKYPAGDGRCRIDAGERGRATFCLPTGYEEEITEAIQERLNRLEAPPGGGGVRRPNAGLRLAVVLTFAVWFLVGPSAPAPKPPAKTSDPIRTTELEIVDATGKTRMALKMDENSAPTLMMFDEKAHLRASLTVFTKGPVLGLFDETGIPRALVSMLTDGPQFGLSDGKGNPRVTLTVSTDLPALSLWDKNGTARAWLDVDAAGPGLHLSDQNGRKRALLAADTDGPVLGLLDEKDKPRATVVVPAAGPDLMLFDKDGKVIWQAPPTMSGLPPVAPK